MSSAASSSATGAAGASSAAPAAAAGTSSGQAGPAFAEYTPPTIRRVSYVLDSVNVPPQYFRLPSAAEASLYRENDMERGGPLLYPVDAKSRASNSHSGSTLQAASHPQHRLPIAALALDATTILRSSQGNASSSPRGIMYMGGRDGMLSSWELGLPMRRRARRRRGVRRAGPGESVEGDEDDDEDEFVSRISLEEGSMPYTHRADRGSDSLEAQWEAVHPDVLGHNTPGRCSFRQCIESHTDWINDIILVNDNQTVISASSDRTVNLWNPHDEHSSLTPKVLGTHKDYVRALTHAQHASWVASGSFDKTIKLWDIGQVRKDPIMTLAEPSVSSSVYALVANPSGSVIVGGSPERIIRAWDPRSGQQIGQLIGHGDAIRSVLVSEDGRHVLSASADSTIRLWDLVEQRCLHTFTHHSDSVWSLFSAHPNLDIFYSGDRSGIVCKVDWERCAEVSDGECVLLAQDTAGPEIEPEGFRTHSNLLGINKIVALDDSYFWTASSSGSVSRWRDIPTRSTREALYPVTERGVSSLHAIDERATAQHGQDAPQSSLSTSVNPRVSALKSQQQHRSSHSVSSVSFASQVEERLEQTSFMRLSNSPSTDSPMTPARDARPNCTLFGIPFESLVCLAPPNDPYGAAIGLGSISARPSSRAAQASKDVDGIFSSASLVSIPAALRSSYQALYDGDSSVRSSMQLARQQGTPLLEQSSSFNAGLPYGKREAWAGRPTSVRSGSLRFAPPHSSSYEEGAANDLEQKHGIDYQERSQLEIIEEARQAYEERDMAIDALPLRDNAEDVVWCAKGLIRCTLLNDRRHCLTIDTAAEVYVWDILLGRCLGAFAWNDVLEEARSTGMTGSLQAADALDLVRERIQGSSAMPNWCNVDTKIGSLSVHLEYPRCFDAEIYTDRIADALRSSDAAFAIRDDQRINVGMTALQNLFDGFVGKETALRLAANAPLKDGTLAYERPDIVRRLNTVSSSEPSRLQSSRIPSTPGMTIAIARPAKTLAVLASPSPLTPQEEHGMSSLQKLLEDQRQAISGKAVTPAAMQSAASDYFSIERKSEDQNGAMTPRQKTPVTEKGGSGFMGRLRMGLRRDNTNQRRDPKNLQGVELESDPMQDSISSLPEVDDASIPGRAEAQKQLQRLRILFKRASQHKDEPVDIPRLTYSRSISLILSESSHDSGGFEVSYRGLVGSTADDTSLLEMHAPLWLLENLLMPGEGLLNLSKSKEKTTFLLVPWSPPGLPPSADGETNADAIPRDAHPLVLPPLPGNNARLTATKMLRVKKACGYIAERLQLMEGRQAIGSTSGLASIAASRRSSSSTPQVTSGMASSLTSSSDGTDGNALNRMAMTRLQQHQQTQQHQQAASQNVSSSLASDNNTSEQSTEPSTSLGSGTGLSIHVPSSASAPHEILEIICKDQIVAPHMTLAQIQRFIWKSGSPPKLEYRLKSSVA